MSLIKSVEINEIKTPLKVPFVTALRRVSHVESIIVIITDDDGFKGYGETVPTARITGDLYNGIKEAIDGYIGPAIVGMDTDRPEDIIKVVGECIHGNTSPKAACEIALFDLFAKIKNKPLYKYLGGEKRPLITDVTISLGDIETMVSDAKRAKEDGFSIVKIKLGGRDGLDDKRVIAINKASPELALRLDANQAFTVEETLKVMDTIENSGIKPELLEQPVHYSDIEGLKFVRERINTPILADESVFSFSDARKIIEMGAADYINIKLMKTGGISAAGDIANLAAKNGIKCMMGCMLESRLSVSAAAHFAAAHSNILFLDLDGPGLCAEDNYLGGPGFIGEVISLNESPGLGMEVRAFP